MKRIICLALSIVIVFSFTFNMHIKAVDAKTIKIVKEQGSCTAVTRANIKIRKIKFGVKYKTIKKFEKAQKNTQNKPSIAKSTDGYKYVMYSFINKNKKKMFGVKPDVRNGKLTYVFYKNRLKEFRYEYGEISKKEVQQNQKKYY